MENGEQQLHRSIECALSCISLLHRTSLKRLPWVTGNTFYGYFYYSDAAHRLQFVLPFKIHVCHMHGCMYVNQCACVHITCLLISYYDEITRAIGGLNDVNIVVIVPAIKRCCFAHHQSTAVWIVRECCMLTCFCLHSSDRESCKIVLSKCGHLQFLGIFYSLGSYFFGVVVVAAAAAIVAWLLDGTKKSFRLFVAVAVVVVCRWRWRREIGDTANQSGNSASEYTHTYCYDWLIVLWFLFQLWHTFKKTQLTTNENMWFSRMHWRLTVLFPFHKTLSKCTYETNDGDMINQPEKKENQNKLIIIKMKINCM